jgi:hypothetical protein
MRIVSQIRKEFDVEIPLRVIFESPTIELLANQIARRQAGSNASDKIEELLSELESLSEDRDERAIIGNE